MWSEVELSAGHSRGSAAVGGPFVGAWTSHLMSMTQEARFVVMEGQVDRGSRLSESEGFGEGRSGGSIS